jgi:hypothetical protein
MNKLICILVIFFPVVVFAQQPWFNSSQFGYSWQNVGNADFAADASDYLSFKISPSGQPYVAFPDCDNSWRASVMKYDGNSWVNVGNAGFSSAKVGFPCLAFSPSDSMPYIAFINYSGSNRGGMSVMKFNGSRKWIDLKINGYIGDLISLAVSPSGEPYLAFRDFDIWGDSSERISVIKIIGTDWMYVGNPYFSPWKINFTSIAFSPSGQPYVAFGDSGKFNKATVMQFNGTNWVTVGSADFSAGWTSDIGLAFNPIDGQPYVAYEDGGNSIKATVMKLNGNNWENVGKAGFSAGKAYFTSLAFDPTGQPYVAYEDGANSFKATVMKFDGSSWVNVGNAGFSANVVSSTCLAINMQGEPYVAYRDEANNLGIIVMRYGSNAGIGELTSSGISIYPNPAHDNITIETSFTLSQVQLSISNLDGKQLITRQITQPKTQIDISNLPNGVYFVRLTNDETVEVGKFVKQ